MLLLMFVSTLISYFSGCFHYYGIQITDLPCKWHLEMSSSLMYVRFYVRVHLQVDYLILGVTFPCKQVLGEGSKEVSHTTILLIYLVLHLLCELQNMFINSLIRCLLQKTSAQLSVDLQQCQTHWLVQHL